MHSSLCLSWKIVVTVPEGGADYNNGTKLFNVTTAKSFLTSIGGMTSCAFFPSTLNPTNVFYNALRKSKIENDIVGKKFPFQLRSKYSNSPLTLRLKLHQFGSNVVIIRVDLNAIDIDIPSVDLQTLQDLESHHRLYSFIRTICGLVESGDHRNSAFDKKPKIYPCTLVTSGESYNSVSDVRAIETLTRHSNLTSKIVNQVLEKNEGHQLDRNSLILLDRQGMFASVWESPAGTGSPNRKYLSANSMLELAIALWSLLIHGHYSNLSSDEQASVDELIHNPNIAFAKSSTALRTWKLLLSEFQLVEVFRKCADIENDDFTQGESKPSKSSDRREVRTRAYGLKLSLAWLKENPISLLIGALAALIIAVATLASSIDELNALWSKYVTAEADPRSYDFHGRLVALSGGNGLSIGRAIVIENAITADAGICAEQYWIRRFYPDYRQSNQKLIRPNGDTPPIYDVVTIQSPTGFRRELFFEISDFFGSPLNDKNAQRRYEELLSKFVRASKSNRDEAGITVEIDAAFTCP